MAAPSGQFVWGDLPDEMRIEIVERFVFFPWGRAALVLFAQTSKHYFKKYSKRFPFKERFGGPNVDLLASALSSGRWNAFLYLCPEPVFCLQKQVRAKMAHSDERRRLTAAVGNSGNLDFIKEWHTYLYGLPGIPEARRHRKLEDTILASTAGMFGYESLEPMFIKCLEIWEKRYRPHTHAYVKHEEREPFSILIAKYGSGKEMTVAKDRGYIIPNTIFNEVVMYGNASVLQWIVDQKPKLLFLDQRNFENRFYFIVRSRFRAQLTEVILRDERITPFLLDGTMFSSANLNNAEDVLLLIMDDHRIKKPPKQFGLTLSVVSRKPYPRIAEMLMKDPIVDPNCK
jgi:hypothetical protein